MGDSERRSQKEAESIESPCVDVCVINPETGLCEGCARTLEEIAEWSTYVPAERRRIIKELPLRR